MTEKMLPLIEAMRAVVRARYPARPALADEVQTADWFRPPLDGSVRPVEERQAVDDAFDTLRDAIANQDVRLHGRLNGGTGADINPTEIDRRGISVLENELEVYQKRTRTRAFQHLRTYLNVHCYAGDIDALIGTCAALLPIDACKLALKACYPPDGTVPADVVNKILCKTIGAWMKEKFPAMPFSDSTILRAAGRKK